MNNRLTSKFEVVRLGRVAMTFFVFALPLIFVISTIGSSFMMLFCKKK